MQMPFPCSNRMLALSAGLVLLTCLTGCATTASKPTSSLSGRTHSNADAGKDTHTVVPSGVQRTLGFFSPHQIDIQQGNFISKEMMAQLKEGMTADQVRFVLGTPLLTDLLHTERWDYPFRLKKANGEIITSHVVVFFKDQHVVRFEGGNLPTEKDYIARIAAPTLESANK